MANPIKTHPRLRYVLWAGAAAALALVAWFVVSHKRASSATAATDTSGRPGPDLSGSAAQQPNGGAASVPGNMPLLVQPDGLQTAVQLAAADSGQSPTMSPQVQNAIATGYTPSVVNASGYNQGAAIQQAIAAGVTPSQINNQNPGVVAAQPPAVYTPHDLTSRL